MKPGAHNQTSREVCMKSRIRERVNKELDRTGIEPSYCETLGTTGSTGVTSGDFEQHSQHINGSICASKLDFCCEPVVDLFVLSCLVLSWPSSTSWANTLFADQSRKRYDKGKIHMAGKREINFYTMRSDLFWPAGRPAVRSASSNNGMTWIVYVACAY